MKVSEQKNMKINLSNLNSFLLGEYTCQIDDERGVKTSGYLYVEGN